MGSLDKIAQARARARRAAASGGGTLDQIAAQRAGDGGSLAEPVDTAPPSKKKSKGGGGILGKIEGAAHYVAKKTELAASDVKNIPGGLVDVGEALTRDQIDQLKHGDFSGPVGALLHGKRTRQIEKGAVKGTIETVKHPLRDPFQTALLAGSLLSGGASVAGRAAEAGRVASEGGSLAKVAKAAVKKPPVKPRLIDVGETKVPLQPAKNPAYRAVQKIHDKAIQKALKENPEGRVARYANKRIGGSIAETARYQARLRDVPVQQLDRAAKRLHSVKGVHGGNRLKQAALELTSANTTPERASAYHAAQAERGVNVAQNRAVAELYRRVAEDKLLTTNEHGDVIVNAEKHPKLAVADARLAEAQRRGDEILRRYGVRSAEALAQRVNAPGRIREGASYKPETLADVEKPTQHIGKAVRAVVTTETDALKQAYRQYVQDDPFAPDRMTAEEYAAAHPELVGKSNTRKFEAPGKVEAVDAKAGTATVRFFKKGGGSWTREVPLADVRTGVGKLEGGEKAHPGRGFVSYARTEPKASKSSVAGVQGPVIGEAKSPISSKEFRGTGIEHGHVPSDVTGQASRHLHQVIRFLNTSELRALVAKTGSNVRRSSRDILIRVPGENHAAIPNEIEALLGRKRLTTDDVAGIDAALQAYREELLPGLRDRFASDRQTEIGVPAPAGYKWVDQNIVGDLAKMPRGPRGRVARTADWLNSAVTAATVYFKIGHVGTRVLTNAATNIIQGSATPLQLAKSRILFGELSEADRFRALAAAGQHGFESMPHEGISKAARVAGKGANWWAKHADAPFRFNSIAYEARKAGIKTADQFRHFLDDLENPERLTPEQFAKVDAIAKRANREGIAYDRLSEAERRYIARGVWFYSWVKGTINFAANTALEHPYKAEIGAQAGALGRQNQANELGDLPTYEQGLFQLFGGRRPLVTDFSTFSPFATPADVANAVARPAELSGQLNPALTAATDLIFGRNQYGGKSQSPIKDAIAALVAPTPEAQIAQAYLERNQNQSRRMFEHTPLAALLRALVGPAMPRRINTSAAHKAAARERSGR